MDEVRWSDFAEVGALEMAAQHRVNMMSEMEFEARRGLRDSADHVAAISHVRPYPFFFRRSRC